MQQSCQASVYANCMNSNKHSHRQKNSKLNSFALRCAFQFFNTILSSFQWSLLETIQQLHQLSVHQFLVFITFTIVHRRRHSFCIAASLVILRPMSWRWFMGAFTFWVKFWIGQNSALPPESPFWRHSLKECSPMRILNQQSTISLLQSSVNDRSTPLTQSIVAPVSKYMQPSEHRAHEPDQQIQPKLLFGWSFNILRKLKMEENLNEVTENKSIIVSIYAKNAIELSWESVQKFQIPTAWDTSTWMHICAGTLPPAGRKINFYNQPERINLQDASRIWNLQGMTRSWVMLKVTWIWTSSYANCGSKKKIAWRKQFHHWLRLFEK